MKYPRFLEHPLDAPGARRKVRWVLGARQTGKSTLFSRIGGRNAVAFDLQDRSERMRLARDPEAFTRALLPPPKRRLHVLVDEIQRVPELLDEIQRLADRHPGRFTFTITGSSARRLRGRDVNLLPGRVHRYPLGPVCRWEEAGAGPFAVLPPPARAPKGAFPARRLEERLVFGALPAAFVEGRAYGRTLASYAEAYVEEEILREAAARNVGDYGRFLEAAAIESGRLLNLTKVSQSSGVAVSTLQGFYRVLEDTLLGFSIRPFSRAGRARIFRSPKFYFFDVGVRNAVARLPLDAGILSLEGGPMLEHWVACELAIRAAYLGPGYRLSFWRTHDGAEVDFILETPREAIPIEVKWTASPRPADAGGAERFITRYGRFARRGFVVCRCRRPEQLTRRVRAIPWSEL